MHKITKESVINSNIPTLSNVLVPLNNKEVRRIMKTTNGETESEMKENARIQNIQVDRV